MDFWLNALESRGATIPPPSRSVTSAASLIAWDEELELLRRLMFAARVRRNGSSPTGALPPEVLARIFELLSEGQIYDSYSKKDWRFTTVSSVCSRWRQIALTTPSLWTHLDPWSRPPWEILLSRSGNGFVPVGDITRVYRSTSRFTDANSDRSPLQPVRSYDHRPTTI